MELHARNREEQREEPATGTPRRASYGVLLADAHDAATLARQRQTGPFDDPHHAVGVVVDYERYLAIAGRHLRLLGSTATDGSALMSRQHRELVARLAALRMVRHGDNAWATAGDRLGIAHDVLATHVGPHGELRTAEAAVLSEPNVQVAATIRTLDLVAEPLSLAHHLLHAARAAQPRRDAPLTRSMTAHLRQSTATIQRVLAMTPVRDVPAHDVLGPLDRLSPATTLVGAGTGPDVLVTRISALQALRQLCFRQRLGVEPANAHTLQDLCRLGAATCRAAETLLPAAQTPLGRVQRAATIDRLRHATELWDGLGRSLVPNVRGLSRAPAIYHAAIQTVSAGTTCNPALTRVALATLPTLAAEAAGIVDRLQERHELVAAHREPGRLGVRWELLDAASGHALAARFTAASAVAHEAADSFKVATADVSRRREVPRRTAPPRQRAREVSR